MLKNLEHITTDKAKRMSVLTLAFVGDAVFTLFVRERLSTTSDYKPGVLTKRAAMLVSATAQSKMLDEISPLLSEDEASIVKSGRNAHTLHKAKNATMADYKKSTSLESLFGYLYLTGQEERLKELQEKSIGVFKE